MALRRLSVFWGVAFGEVLSFTSERKYPKNAAKTKVLDS